jgi:hypothetical protein
MPSRSNCSLLQSVTELLRHRATNKKASFFVAEYILICVPDSKIFFLFQFKNLGS